MQPAVAEWQPALQLHDFWLPPKTAAHEHEAIPELSFRVAK